MKLNSIAEWCAGIGGTTVSYGGKPIASPAGGANWMDDDHIVYQVCDGAGCRVERYNVRTGVKDTLFAHGANFVEAGGGITAAWFGSTDPSNNGISLSDGRRFPISGLGPVGPDGAVAIKDDYQSAGPWHVIERDGSSWLLSAGDAFAINLLGNRRALFAGAAGWTGINMPTPKVLPGNAWWMRVIDIAGEWWALYQHEDGSLVLHPFTSTVGYRIAPAGSLTYRPDIVVLHDRTVRVVWASREDEGPDVQQVRDLDTTTIRTELATPVVVPQPQPKPIPKPEPTPVSSQAPNQFAVVQRVFAAHPEIDRVNEDTRGRAVDYVIAELGGKPWGRKAKNKDGSNLNTDGLTYLRTDGLYEIYDIINGTTGAATWDGGDPVVQGQNGWWAPGLPVGAVVDPGHTEPPVNSSFGAAATALEARILSLSTIVNALKATVEELKNRPVAVEPKVSGIDGLRIALKTDNGHFLSAQDGGGGVVHTQRPEPGAPVEGYTPGGWETFTVVTR